MMPIMTCPVCMRQYSGRRDKLTCSPKCKKRLQRRKPKSEMLKEAYSEAISGARLLGMYLDDPNLKARAHNSLKSLIKSMCEYMPDYERLAIAQELTHSVSSEAYLERELNRSKAGQINVPHKESD
jgi:hypothetical protein